ncbi:2OG-Fe(II) oxygenase [Halopseudomonas pelagia]|uniref:2OG-Fe(II) oxygenase n=1 Tax=Halopseudomonas pelagia TaxID=553151 RepID=UPI00039C8AEA|nr:2OG-Fe(II) oxygenase [Halopseudomonas pelagia]|tara:strand:- start:115627 stop:116262 length:636 start_codon:yes stop_codon:yes gene_type:complete
MAEFPVPPSTCFERVADDLASCGWSVQQDALSSELVDSLAAQCKRLWQADDLTPAAVGPLGEELVIPSIRGDYTRWLDDCPPCIANDQFLALMEALRVALNRSLFLGLDSFETHYALYPPGAGYRKHLDRFKGNPLRTVSVVAYLNQHWRPGDGGELRLHLPQGQRDIAPRGGSLAVFMSDRTVHEVLAAHRERASLVGWFRRRPDNPLLC